MRLLLALPFADEPTERAVREFGATPATATLSLEELVARAHDERPEALLVAGSHRFDRAALDRLPDSVRIIATHSVGFDHLDPVAAAERGIVMSNTPDVLTDATADQALLLLLMVARRAQEQLTATREGWRRRIPQNAMLGTDLAGKQLGIVGMGRIGRAVAVRARAFGMRIAYHNRHPLPPELEGDAVYHASLDTLLASSQVLSLNLPAQGDRVLMTAERFAAMPAGAIFINTARGSLVDEDALLASLDSGHLRGAGLDVYRQEPDFDLRLRGRDDVVCLPHMGSATEETRTAMGHRALDNIAAVLGGESAPDALLR